ncbi:DNA polymerase III subunit alpha [Aquisalibacillus elongatus]|uniref:DNA polymerase III subunit alpha n=1 Tax=Aquisalibacillus elongatus TaxID=485577 RepID=A0A3N5C9U6_9BACI|nr:DNA polymerase III subunit alpha [Aquisalibacillus elongatus]RPF55365.1 DNA polymerase III catalytic subunit DnaE type [Aquisalibacillus elongatus]
MSFVHLQVKSSYSFLNSTIKIDSYVKRAKQLGYDACALTDHEVLHGAYAFYQACQKEDIKPIIGMSIQAVIGDEQRPVTFYLYAKNIEGYQSLVHLSNLKQYHKEKVTLDHIAQCKGLTTVVSFYATYVEEIMYLEDHQRIRELVNTIDEKSDDWYIHVQPIGTEKQLVTNWIENDSFLFEKSVLMCDVRYLVDSDRIGYESLLAMRHSTTLQQVRRQGVPGTYFMSEEEIDELIEEKWLSTKENTVKIANQIHIELPDQWFGLPSYEETGGISSDEYLRQLCEKQLDKVYSTNHQEAVNRLNHELSVIQSMHFSDYFLIVKDMIDYAKKEGILVGPGRGSAAGSIVAYLLGIIEVDPLKYGLLFERFLNPERRQMPDIDIDFSDYRRDEVIQYVSRKYGRERVAQIMTFGTFQARSIIRELSKVFEIEKDQLTYLLKQLSSSTTLKELVKDNSELLAFIKQSDVLRQLFKAALVIEGLPRHYSTHAAGIVIADQPLTNSIPVIEGQESVMLTQYPMDQLESVGLLKMDLLGLRNLTLLERIIKQIEEHEGRTVSLQKLGLEDQRTYQILRKAMTTGVFQFESSGMKQALRAIKPNRLEDIVVVNALFRPGPMQFIETFAKRKHGEERVQYIHEDLKPLLEETYGVLVYQEQIMMAVNQFAGFTLGQADLLRRAISKKDREAIHQMKQQFLQGSKEHGYDDSTAIKLFDWIERFADYGFNKSHAVAYSIISYQTAYFKANYPAYFYAELISSVMHDDEKVAKYIKEARHQGVEILPPSINHSFGKFTVESAKKIRFGLLAIKNVGKQAFDEILKGRKNGNYKNIFDFCKKVDLKTINQSVIETLIMAGALDEMKKHRAQLLATVMPAMEQGELFSDMNEQLNWSDELFHMDVEYPNVEPFPVMKQLSMEKDVLGFVISEHPIRHIRRTLKKKQFYSITESIQRKMTRVNLVVNVERIHEIRTKRGEKMAFLTVQDETEELEAVLFPKLHREVYRWLEEDQFIELNGKLDERQGELQLILNSVKPFDIDSVPKANDAQIFIKFHGSDEKQQLKQLKQISEQYGGNTPVVIYAPYRNKTYQLSEAYDLAETSEALKQLEEAFGHEHVKVKRN